MNPIGQNLMDFEKQKQNCTSLIQYVYCVKNCTSLIQLLLKVLHVLHRLSKVLQRKCLQKYD